MKPLGFLLLLIFPLLASAQLVPLELDQTITLPQAGAIWDVMPHPDGYYLWVQAVTHDSTQTRIYWGRTDSAGVDSLDLSIGSPISIHAFWGGGYEAEVLIASSFSTAWSVESFQVFRLSDGAPLTPALGWHYEHTDLHQHWDIDEYRVATAAPLPPPPAVSTIVPALIRYHYHYLDDEGSSRFTDDTHKGLLLANILAGDTTVTARLDMVSSAAWAWDGRTVHLARAGTSTSSFEGPGGNHVSVNYRASTLELMADTVRESWAAACGLPDSNSDLCFEGDVLCTYDSTTGRPVFFGDVGSNWAAEDSLGELWRIPNSYWTTLAANVIGGNSSEEFLCYRWNQQDFEVLNATNGHSYGHTDTLAIDPWSFDLRIIGRYDGSARRLGNRDGSRIKLYRFGEYLDIDVGQRSAQVESYSLSAFPNPFNPATQITFTVPRAQRVKLTVYDIMGREVLLLTNTSYEAGEHQVTFDGSNLPSGIYFARLATGSVNKTQKLLLLK